jgi:predicted MFS family arabinose efflux permease
VLPPMSLAARCIAAALFLLPMGFLLGAPFPSGMRLFAARRAQHIPLVWGLNGIASVFGSLCAAMIAKSSGFDRALLGGVSIYLLAAVLLAALGESKKVLTADERGERFDE